MPRPPLPPGTGGKIKVYCMGGRQWRARCKYRDHTGKIHYPERYAPTKARAENRLREALRDWSGATSDADTRMEALAEAWIAEVTVEVCAGNRSQTTADRYRQRLDQWVLPALGQLRAREVTTAIVVRVLADVRQRTSTSNARTVRSVISGVCGYAVRVGAMSTNPVAEAGRLEVPKADRTGTGRALTPEQVFDLLAKLDASEHAVKHDLPDLVRLFVATGERIGEALGARWCDFDEHGGYLVMGRNVVRTSVGLLVNDGKTDTSRRTIPLPRWCVDMLVERRAALTRGKRKAGSVGSVVGLDGGDTGTGQGLIFPSTRGTVREPSNIYNRAWGPFRAEAGYEWVTFHTFRRTVATLLDEANLSARQIADVLGHARPSMTTDVYMARQLPGRASADALDAMWRKAGEA